MIDSARLLHQCRVGGALFDLLLLAAIGRAAGGDHWPQFRRDTRARR